MYLLNKLIWASEAVPFATTFIRSFNERSIFAIALRLEIIIALSTAVISTVLGGGGRGYAPEGLGGPACGVFACGAPDPAGFEGASVVLAEEVGAAVPRVLGGEELLAVFFLSASSFGC